MPDENGNITIADVVAVHGYDQRVPSTPPLTATASSRPCQLHEYHAPRPSRTQGHHRHPVYLQNQVYGNIQDSELLWVCGTCHDSIHEWLSFLLTEAREPNPHPGRKAKAEAQYSYDWYMGAKRD